MVAPYPVRFVIVDTETAPADVPDEDKVDIQRFRMGVARIYDAMAQGGEPYRTVAFTDTAVFHQAVAAMPLSSEPIYIFAHNMAFDAKTLHLTFALGEGLYTLDAPRSVKNWAYFKKPYFVTGSPPFIVRTWRPDGQKIWWLDSYQWLSRSLAAIGTMLGFEKGKRPDWEASDEEWFIYCERDVAVLDHALQSLWGYLRTRHLGDYQFTPGMQAMKLWRGRYERKRIERPEDPELSVLDRHGYYGGRFESFAVRRIEGPIYQVDCNGLYPHVMRHNQAPRAIVEYSLGGKERFKPSEIALGECTAEVWLQTDDHPYPVRCHDGTFHVVGKVHTVLPGPELMRAHARGHVAEVGDYVRYDLADLFMGYISTLDKFRMDAFEADDDFARLILKGLLNNLFGKMGQKTGDWLFAGEGPDKKRYGTGVVMGEHVDDNTEYRFLGGKQWYRTLDREGEGAMVAIAAWCNSYARVYMDEVKEVVGAANVFSQATDSLLVNQAGYDRLRAAGLLDEREMGKFKKEDTYEWVDIRNINYILHDHGRKAAGIPYDAEDLGNDTYQFEIWDSFDQSLAAGHLNEQWIRTVERRLDAPFRGRRVKAGGETEPHVIDNWSMSLEAQKKACLRSRNQRRRQGPRLS